MSHIPCVQGSADWFSERTGRVTASRLADALSFLKRGGESQARKDYKTEIVVECLTGLAQEHYVSPAMIWGTQNEPFARALYEVRNDVSVEQCGLFVHPTIRNFAASPDFLIGEDGLGEIKCPTS